MTLSYKPNSNLGVSLLELLLVLSIIAILAAITYPSYSHHLTNVRRVNAVASLLEITGRLEQFYVQQNSYEGASLTKLNIDDAPYKNNYRVTLEVTADTYNIHAMPIGRQADADITCGTLSIDENGNKMISGTGSIQACWQ